MEKTDGLNGWAKFLNSKVKVIYDDGSHVTIKFGTLIDADSDFLFLRTDEGQQSINKTKIIRVEKC